MVVLFVLCNTVNQNIDNLMRCGQQRIVGATVQGSHFLVDLRFIFCNKDSNLLRL